MSPYKLSLFNPGNDDDREEIDVPDELVDQLRATVDATPDLTLTDALHEGIKHVVDKRRGGGQQ